jgi:gliding motility-associated-like protein
MFVAMKKYFNFNIITIFIFLFVNIAFLTDLFSQDWEWAKHFSGTSQIKVNSQSYSEIDNSVVIVVEFQGSMTEGVNNFTSLGSNDILVAKYNSSGNLLWSSQIAGTGKDIPKDIYVNNLGEIFVTGSFSETVNVDGQIIVSTGSEDVFVAKYNSNGTLLWIKNVGWGSDVDRGSNLSFDNQNNIYLTGFFNDEIIFGSDTLQSNSTTDNFVLKLNNSGQYLLSLHFKGNNENTRLNSIATSIDGGKLISGFFIDTLIFPNNDTLIGKGNEDLVVFKLDVNDNIQWIRQIGGIASDIGYDAKSDDYGSIYVVGQIEGTVEVDSTDKAIFDASPITSNGSTDIILAKYNKQGRLLWRKNFGGKGDDIGSGIEINQNLVHFSGHISDTVIIGLDTLVTNGLSDNNACFGVVNTNGDYIDIEQASGDGVDRALNIAYDNQGGEYIGGFFRSTELKVGNFTLTNASGNSREGFLAKWKSKFSISVTSKKDLTCNGVNDGEITVTPYFGTYPYIYQWSHDALLNDSAATDLSAGTYKIKVIDANLKTDSLFVTISEPTPITISSGITDVSCYNGNDGAIDVTVSGGASGNYEYYWLTDIGSGVIPADEDQTGLTHGNYFITVVDYNGCEALDTFLVDQPDKITFGQSIVTGVINPPGNNGDIDLTVSGGTASYAYSWNGPGGFTSSSEDISSLDGGTYSIMITDSKSCTRDTSFLVDDINVLIAYISDKTDVDCKGNANGSATVSVASGGSGNYYYYWRLFPSADTIQEGVNNTITGLDARKYTVIVNDIDSVKSTVVTFEIFEPLQDLALSVNPTHLSCHEDTSGIADLTITGGTLPYVFAWSNGKTSEDLVNVESGTYSVIVTDANGCNDNIAVQLNEPDLLDLSIVIEQQILCNGELTGRARADVTGGTGTKSYLWDDPASQNTSLATGLGDGIYNILVTDQNDCEITNFIELVEPQEISVTADIQHPSCYGLKDGRIIPTVTGGTAPFEYVWSTGWSSRIISFIGDGDYSVTITDDNNCTDFQEYTLNEPPQIVFQSIGITDASCFGYNDGSISIIAGGGSGIYEYSANNGGAYQASPDFLTLYADDYQLKIKDNSDCESTDSIITLGQPDGIDIESEDIQNITCSGEENGSIIIVASGGAGNFLYSINDGADYVDNSGLFTGLADGNYAVKVKDADNCEMPGSNLYIIEPDKLTIDTTSVVHGTSIQNGYVTLESDGGTGIVSFVLVPEGADSITNNNGQFNDLAEGNYIFYAVDDNECFSDSIDVNILSIDVTTLIIYDAFSPNNDAINDVWNIGNIQTYPYCTVKIYNSWGNEVFSSNGYPNPWDGKYNGKELPSGTYYYVIDLGEGSTPVTGPVSLIK